MDYYPEQEYQNEYTSIIYVSMHSIFYDIKAQCKGIHDLYHLWYKHKIPGT